MRSSKLIKYEQQIVGILTLLVGIGHGITYALKIDKCEKCGNFVDSSVVDWFHRSNYTMWFLLCYAVLINGAFYKFRVIFFVGILVSEYLVCNEFFGKPKDWGVPVVIGFVLVLLLGIYKYNNHIFKKKSYI